MVRGERANVLSTIGKFIKNYGYSPSIRELCFLSGKNSTTTIHYHLKKLKDAGYIDYISGHFRTISLTEKGKKIVRRKK